MVDLSNTTIVSVNCVKPEDGIAAIKYSSRGIKFGRSVLFTDSYIEPVEGIEIVKIPKLKSVDEYNDFILRLAGYIDSDFCLIVQDDGFVLNPGKWNPDFLKYDYIGAPWPDNFAWKQLQTGKSYMTPGWNRVGNGGFSLRSRKFLEVSSKFDTCFGFGEDFFLCVIKHGVLKMHNIQWAPIELARTFSYENNIENWPAPVELDPFSTFGFHGHQLTNSHRLIALKNKKD